MEYPLVSAFETNPEGFNPITSESVPVNRKNIEIEIQVTCDFYNGTWGPVTMTSWDKMTSQIRGVIRRWDL